MARTADTPTLPGAPKLPGRIRTVDGLRGLAALLVVFDHAVGDSWGLGAWSEQNHGIIVFAFLTGFLLSGRFFRSRLDRADPPRAIEFLRTRAARIYPGYWVALGIAALAIGLHQMHGGDTWRVITLTQIYGTDTPFEGLPPTWSLSLFLSFYIALPFWTWARSRTERGGRSQISMIKREVLWLAVVVVLAIAVRASAVTDPIAHDPKFSLFGRADWFAMGMILAALAIGHARGLLPQWVLAPGRHPSIAFAIAIGLTVVSAILPPGLDELRTQCDSFAAAILVAGAILHGSRLLGPQRLLASRPARALGRWSYGIFLWGYIAQKALTQAFPAISTGALLALSMAGAIALGAASWRFVEEPASRFVRDRLSRRKAQAFRRGRSDSTSSAEIPGTCARSSAVR